MAKPPSAVVIEKAFAGDLDTLATKLAGAFLPPYLSLSGQNYLKSDELKALKPGALVRRALMVRSSGIAGQFLTNLLFLQSLF